jgi:hypothetical protein
VNPMIHPEVRQAFLGYLGLGVDANAGLEHPAMDEVRAVSVKRAFPSLPGSFTFTPGEPRNNLLAGIWHFVARWTQEDGIFLANFERRAAARSHG